MTCRFQICRVSDFEGQGLIVNDPLGIKKGEIIGIYAGLLHHISSAEYDPLTNYAFCFTPPKLKEWLIDSAVYGNYTSKINHAKIQERECNAYSIEYFDKSGPYILIAANQDIANGQEVKMSYGTTYWTHTSIKPRQR